MQGVFRLFDQLYPQTITYLGIRLTVQCDDPQDPFFHPHDFFPTAKEGGVYVGRSAGNDIQLSNAGVSSVHCRVEAVGGEYFLEDGGSSNGTYVMHRRLAPGERYSLRDGDVIRILNYNITFRIGLSAFTPSRPGIDQESTMQVGHAMVQQFLDNPEEHSPQLYVRDMNQQESVFTLSNYEDCYVGRDPSCQICLQEDAVSRRHAMIRRDWSGVTIRDLNSSNGVVLRGVRIKANTEVELNDGDLISIGHCTLSFRDPFAASLEDKLKGVWQDEVDDSTMGAATVIGERRKPAALSKEPTAQDVREPTSGRWRSPKRGAKPQAPPPTKQPEQEKNVTPVQESIPEAENLSEPQESPKPVTKSVEEKEGGAEGEEKSFSPEQSSHREPFQPSHRGNGRLGKIEKGVVGLVVGLVFLLVVLVFCLLFLV